MRLAGYQPQYFPRLHYMNRILDSDIFEISDYIQFVARHDFPQKDGSVKRDKSHQVHAPIKLNEGAFYLTIPVHDKLLPINRTEIDYSKDWAEKQLKTIEIGYRRSPNFEKYYKEIEEILNHKYENLADLTIKSVLWGIVRLITGDNFDLKDLNVESVNKLLNERENPFLLKKIFLASRSGVPAPGKGEANDWIIKLCKSVGADEYFYGGTSHSAYMDLEKYEKAGIKSVLQDWKCEEYTQQYMKTGFIPNLSVVDLIFNTDLQTRQKIIS